MLLKRLQNYLQCESLSVSSGPTITAFKLMSDRETHMTYVTYHMWHTSQISDFPRGNSLQAIIEEYVIRVYYGQITKNSYTVHTIIILTNSLNLETMQSLQCISYTLKMTMQKRPQQKQIIDLELNITVYIFKLKKR